MRQTGPVSRVIRGSRAWGSAARARGGPVATRGVLYIHSAAPAVCPHVEWAVAGVLGVSAPLSWTAQPAARGSLRVELSW
ncbi:MAG: DUF3145 family protein, partial [Acidothermales bacterium]|nr:DUF3145 family protein [Acidothermales bacterium]